MTTRSMNHTYAVSSLFKLAALIIPRSVINSTYLPPIIKEDIERIKRNKIKKLLEDDFPYCSDCNPYGDEDIHVGQQCIECGIEI